MRTTSVSNEIIGHIRGLCCDLTSKECSGNDLLLELKVLISGSAKKMFVAVMTLLNTLKG